MLDEMKKTLPDVDDLSKLLVSKDRDKGRFLRIWIIRIIQ